MALDGSEAEVLQFLADANATNLTHVSEASNGALLNQLVGEYRPTGIPHFVFINQNGEEKTMPGWSQGGLENNVNWLLNN